MVERVLENVADRGTSQSSGSLSKDDLDALSERLRSLGFARADVSAAVQVAEVTAGSDALASESRAIDWLVTNIPEQRLPKVTTASIKRTSLGTELSALCSDLPLVTMRSELKSRVTSTLPNCRSLTGCDAWGIRGELVRRLPMISTVSKKVIHVLVALRAMLTA